MKHVTFNPKGICAMKIDFDIDDDKKLHNVRFTGGCNGNLKAIGLLVEGKEASEMADILRKYGALESCENKLGLTPWDSIGKAIEKNG